MYTKEAMLQSRICCICLIFVAFVTFVAFIKGCWSFAVVHGGALLLISTYHTPLCIMAGISIAKCFSRSLPTQIETNIGQTTFNITDHV